MPGKGKPKASRATKPRSAASKPKAAAKRVMKGKASQSASSRPAVQLIDQRIRAAGGWRGQALANVRRLIHEAVPQVVEECKWFKPSNPLGVPVWSHDGMLCTGEVYKAAVKLTFARGAALPDPKGLFNSSLDAGTRRAIDIHEGDKLDATAFKALVRAAAYENAMAKKQ